MILVSDILANRASKPSTLASLAEDLRMAHAKRRAYRMTLRDLAALDDAALAAAGLTRRQIKQHARQKIYQTAA